MEFKGTAKVTKNHKGQTIILFDRASMELIVKATIKKYGKSNKRINKKRIKKYIMFAILEGIENE